MKRIIKVLISITGLVLLTVFVTGCANSENKQKIRRDQERMVNVIIDKVSLKDTEKIKKIEVIEFGKNQSTGTWHGIIEVNSKYRISLSEDALGGEIIISYFHPEEFIIKNIQQDKNENLNNIEIKYFEG